MMMQCSRRGEISKKGGRIILRTLVHICLKKDTFRRSPTMKLCVATDFRLTRPVNIIHYTHVYNDPKLSEKENLYAVFQQIDGVIILAKNEKNYKAYAMIYFSDKSSLKERQKRLSEIKNFLKSRKYPSNLITIIEGGLRENAVTEFFLLPKDLPPPAPEPGLPSPQFKKSR